MPDVNPSGAAGTSPTALSSPVLETLSWLHQQLSALPDGEVATYIPELAKADPNLFGICLCTIHGSVYEVGDSRVPFTIQSISKPFVYGLALEDNGRESVLSKVGVEPTGDAFNSISLEPGTGRPRNPMINAGAIATTGLIAGKNQAARLKRLMETFGRLAGRELSLDDEVYRSESATGHRNRAIGHMLRNFDILEGDPMPVVELYFQQCSISVTCRDLAVMAATLANRGVNPVTGRTALRGEYVESVLSVMETCGMYNSSGEWVYRIGMPAKSGVAGGVLAVLPGQLGIGVFSPRLDHFGNSVRGVKVCEELSRHLDLHLLNRPGVGRSTIRRRLDGADFNSSRVRTPAENDVLRREGRRIQLYQLQGELFFSTAEVVVRAVLEGVAAADYVLLDLRRVPVINESACRLFFRLAGLLAGQGKALAFTYPDHLPLLRRYFRLKLGEAFEGTFRAFAENDLALEWAEDAVLTRFLPAQAAGVELEPGAYVLFEGLADEEVTAIVASLQHHRFSTGETLVEIGQQADEMFLLASGSVSVVLPLPDGSSRRLATFSAGMSFGEMAMLDQAPRSARIVADGPGTCHVLTRAAYLELCQRHPGLMVRVLQNLCRDLSGRLRKANRELRALD